MKKYMFGLDNADVQGSAKKLAALGYDAVVLGNDPKAHSAAQAAGLKTWLCYGAFSLGNASQKDFGALDAMGRPAPWFSSACPNASELHFVRMEKALEDAKCVGAEGIFVDGARFASFASAEGVRSFFGCFCPRCMKKMAQMGMDAEEVRQGVADVADYLNGSEAHDLSRMRSAVNAWLKFRAEICKDYFDRFAARAHAFGLTAGAFVFASSLWRFVGQGPESCRSLDVVAPMLYRSYPHSEGPACLNHEWAAFHALLKNAPTGAEEAARQLFGTSLRGGEDPMKGFSPEEVGAETACARAALGEDIRLLPILQTEDDRLCDVAQAVLNSGADGYGEFMYSQKKFG